MATFGIKDGVLGKKTFEGRAKTHRVSGCLKRGIIRGFIMEYV